MFSISFSHLTRKSLVLGCFIGSLSISQHIQPNQSYAKTQLPNHAQAMMESAIQVSVGSLYTCAVITSGGVKCWGYNEFGQLGDGGISRQLMPVSVIGLSQDVKTIMTGAYHTCAITMNGSVLCWGRNKEGQLGDGSTTNRSMPVSVIGLSQGVRAITAGMSHTCAITINGGVLCWGDNGSGQLGNGGTNAQSKPVFVPGLSQGFTAIAAGRSHTCALNAGGGVMCWGDNSSGQLGNGSTNAQSTPVSVIGLSQSITAISAGRDHTCAITINGDTQCWGDNQFGQLGDGTIIRRLTPVAAIGLSQSITAISTGWNHTCAITISGGAQCWGDNQFAQLGDGSIVRRSTPMMVRGLSQGITAIAAGGFHTCALRIGGGVICWGTNFEGGLGNGSTSGEVTPVDVIGLESNAAPPTVTFTPTATAVPPTATPIPQNSTSTPIPTATPVPASTSVVANTTWLYMPILAKDLPSDPCLVTDCLEQNNSPNDPSESKKLDFSYAKEIKVGQRVYALVDGLSDPRDYYFLNLPANKSYIAKIRRFGNNAELNLYLHNTQQQQTSPPIPSGVPPPTEEPFKTTINGKYYVLVVAFRSNGPQSYELVVEEQ